MIGGACIVRRTVDEPSGQGWTGREKMCIRDRIHMPDPVSQELCRLEHRVYQNERRLGLQDESEPSKTVENSENGDCD